MFKIIRSGISGFLLIAVFLFIGAGLQAAQLFIPAVIKANDLFVVSLTTDTGADKLINLKFDSARLQFMGAVQGTPDIQIKSDTEIEIKPEKGKLAAEYDLRFIALATGSTVITIVDARGAQIVELTTVAAGSEKGFSWLILVAGAILLIIGLKIWKYQKSAPEMMSTKSLFMNYEELENARRQYLPPDELPEQAAKEPAKETVKDAPAASPLPTGDETKPAKAASQTQKHPAVKREAVKVESENPKPEALYESAPRKTRSQKRVALQNFVIAIESPDGRLYEAEGEVIKIGRRKECQIAISASEISREHVEVTASKGQILVRPLTESNVTRLNDRTLKGAQVMRAGDTLNLGGTSYVVVKARIL